MNIWTWFDLPAAERPPLQQVGGNAYIPYLGWNLTALFGVCNAYNADVESYERYLDLLKKNEDKHKQQLSHISNHDKYVGTTFYNQNIEPPKTVKQWLW